MKKLTHNFKVGSVHYELFNADDGHIEVYEELNPKEGLTFSSKKQLITFVNSLTDVIEGEVL